MPSTVVPPISHSLQTCSPSVTDWRTVAARSGTWANSFPQLPRMRGRPVKLRWGWSGRIEQKSSAKHAVNASRSWPFIAVSMRRRTSWLAGRSLIGRECQPGSRSAWAKLSQADRGRTVIDDLPEPGRVAGTWARGEDHRQRIAIRDREQVAVERDGAGFWVAQHGAVLARDAGGRRAPQAVERPARAAQLVHEGGQRRVGRIAQGRAPKPGGEHGLKAGRTPGGPADPAGGTGEGAPGDVGVPPVAGWVTPLRRAPGPLRAQHVPRRVAQAHRSTVEPLEQAHRSGRDLARHLAAGRAVPSQRAEPFVVRPPQPPCAGQSGHHTGRRVTLPLFQPPPVVSRDPGQLDRLLRAQPPTPPPPAGREPDLSGPGAFPQLTQGRPKFVLLPHGPSVPDPRSWSGGRAVPDCRW